MTIYTLNLDKLSRHNAISLKYIAILFEFLLILDTTARHYFTLKYAAPKICKRMFYELRYCYKSRL